MSTTLYGTITDQLGHARWDNYPWDGRYAERSFNASAQPSANFLVTQPSRIPVDLSHDPDRTVGETVYLERDRAGHLWAVGVINLVLDLDDDERSLWWSASTTGKHQRDSAIFGELRLRSIAVTDAPAGVGLRPLRTLPGDLRRWGDRRYWRHPTPALIERAVTYHARHRRGDPLRIVDAVPIAERFDRAPVGPTIYSGGRGRVLAVR